MAVTAGGDRLGRGARFRSPRACALATCASGDRSLATSSKAAKLSSMPHSLAAALALAGAGAGAPVTVVRARVTLGFGTASSLDRSVIVT